MLLNPYQFRRYLRTDAIKPHGTGWGLLLLALAGCMMAAFPLMAPSEVAINLPRVAHVTTAHQALVTSQTVIVNGSTIIYRGQALSREAFLSGLEKSSNKDRLLILASAGTTLSEVLPLINAAEKAGFSDVAFVVKP